MILRDKFLHLGLLYEGQQWIRKDGQVEWLDALATAAPGWLAWGVLITKDFL